jgi:hypothetical protein
MIKHSVFNESAGKMWDARNNQALKKPECSFPEAGNVK